MNDKGEFKYFVLLYNKQIKPPFDFGSISKNNMTKKSMFRTFETSEPCNITVAMVAFGLLFCLVVYVIEFMILLDPFWKWYVIPVQFILFTMLYWSFLKVYMTDPGTVPKFYAVDKFSFSVQQPRIYCLLCHNFKAERTHHCSTCQKCVLNMDHHCPWINNCVGFYNRKYFILFLFYLSVNILFVLPQQGYLIVKQLIPIINDESTTTIHTAIRILVFLFQLGILFPISTFTAYHMNLVFKNETTLTEMKRERDQQRGKQDQFNIYDVGSYDNFRQVFGKKSWEWFLPITKTLPCDGLNWPKNDWHCK